MRPYLLALTAAVLASPCLAAGPEAQAKSCKPSRQDVQICRDLIAQFAESHRLAAPLSRPSSWTAKPIGGGQCILAGGAADPQFQAMLVKADGQWSLRMIGFQRGFEVRSSDRPSPAMPDAKAWTTADKEFSREISASRLKRLSMSRFRAFLGTAHGSTTSVRAISLGYSSEPSLGPEAAASLSLVRRESDLALISFSILPETAITKAEPPLSEKEARNAFRNQLGFMPDRWTFSSHPYRSRTSFGTTVPHWRASRKPWNIQIDGSSGKVLFYWLDRPGGQQSGAVLDSHSKLRLQKEESRMAANRKAYRSGPSGLPPASEGPSWKPYAIVLAIGAGTALLLWLLVRPRVGMD